MRAAPQQTRLQVLTAWRLGDGEAVYRGTQGWVENLADARAFAKPEDAAAELAAAETDVAARLVVGPYLFEVETRDGRVEALSAREIIRAQGPTVRLDLGKQARA